MPLRAEVISSRPPGADTASAPPATEGLARLPFEVAIAGTYRVWARVSVPSTSADSFWLRMDNGTWIKWNGIDAGSAWHWAELKAEGAVSGPRFPLAAGPHVVTIGYREKNAKLDVLIVTSDLSFDPRKPLTAPPADIAVIGAHPGGGAVKVVWNAVPGAVSYSILRSNWPTWETIATGVSGHAFTDLTATGDPYTVIAHSSTGSSTAVFHPAGSPNGTVLKWRGLPDSLSVTPPMHVDANFDVGAPAGTNSLDAPPARGRARLDFIVPVALQAKLWARTYHPNTATDSFWVRMDDGPWIKWNGIRDFCDDVHNSDRENQPSIFKLASGSHTLEIAYREGGTLLNGIVTLVDDIANLEPCSD